MNTNSITKGVTYRRNLNFVLYNEVVYVDDEIVGAIYDDKENEGFSVKKIVETDNGPEYQFIGNFENVSDAKSFINQAGGI